MANRPNGSRSNSKKAIKDSVILNSEETMRKMDIFGDTLFGKEKEPESSAEQVNLEDLNLENITEKVEEIVPIQEEKIEDFDFENEESEETQNTLEEAEDENLNIAQNSGTDLSSYGTQNIVENENQEIVAEPVENPAIEEVAIDDILSMIDDEETEEIKNEEPIGTADPDSVIAQNSEENLDINVGSEEVTTNEVSNNNFSDFSAEIMGNISSEATESVAQEVEAKSAEELLIGDTLLEIMQNADIDVTAIERVEGREALKMIGE